MKRGEGEMRREITACPAFFCSAYQSELSWRLSSQGNKQGNWNVRPISQAWVLVFEYLDSFLFHIGHDIFRRKRTLV